MEVPPDLAVAPAAAPAAAETWERLSFTHRREREYVRWIVEAKRQQTRDTRVGKAVGMLSAGVRTPD